MHVANWPPGHTMAMEPSTRLAASANDSPPSPPSPPVIPIPMKFAFGCLANCTSSLVLHPLDLTKVRQVMHLLVRIDASFVANHDQHIDLAACHVDVLVLPVLNAPWPKCTCRALSSGCPLLGAASALHHRANCAAQCVHGL